eukprot:NODE_39_length_35218_cov_0.479655.p19 type:complete len:248 gc:universal NODE_39_length_35218_cov_0.479655:15119-15862(+)
MILFDTSISFIVAHLAAGQKHTQDRNKDAKHIINNVAFSNVAIPTVYLDHSGFKLWDQDTLFFFGDLNYRIELTRDQCEQNIRSQNYIELLKNDQLNENRSKNPSCVLRHFQEAPIKFLPTYKYDPYTINYDSSEKKRIPAWCDRILYRGQVDVISYDRLERPFSSDHRAIFGEFVIDCQGLEMDQLLKLIEGYTTLENKIQRLEFINTVRYTLDSFGIQSEVANYVKQPNMNLFQFLQSQKLNSRS